MAIHCPYCRHGMSVRDAKPGRYKPKCSKCGRRFALTFFPESDRQPLIEALPEEGGSATVASATSAPAPQATVVPASPIPGANPASGGIDQTLPMPPAAATKIDVAATLPDTGRQAAATAVDATLPVAAQATIAAGQTQAVGQPGTSGRGISGPAARPANLPDRIGGYRIISELGRGAMGAVYLARQLSLDRDVALKTIQSQWATHPTFVARFVREAYAAAQLTHHNIVQIYDLGADGGINFFSMEFVRGETLEQTLRREGRLSPETAVGYALQAARGLHFAHQHGMVHRDVKPANMMIDRHGTLKIADLGLVKWAGGVSPELDEPPAGVDSPALAQARSDVTIANMAMGTPAYMAPEQADNAAGVDHRADIYSLGCALYAMLTGKAPFDGVTAVEVLSKHRTQPVIRPDALIANLPKDLADITLRMVAKQPEQRYQSLAALIQDLERFLSSKTNQPAGPAEADAQRVAQLARDFQAPGLRRIRDVLLLALVAGGGLCALVTVFSLALGSGMAAGLIAGVVSYVITNGLAGSSPIFDRCRASLFAARWSDWFTWTGGALLVVFALWLAGWFWWWLALVLVGVAMGAVIAWTVDRRLHASRRPAIEGFEELLRGWRVRGWDELLLRRFVAEHAGPDWEELAEVLFGYDEKLRLREELAASPGGLGSRRRFRAWREPLIVRFDRRLRAEQGNRNRQLLTKVEEQGLRAAGVDPQTAREQAGRIAEAMVGDAAAQRAATIHAAQTVVDPAVAAAEKRARIKRMLAEAKGNAQPRREPIWNSGLFAPVRFAFSGKVRFLLGCLLLVGCGLWARQNGLLGDGDLRSMATGATEQLRSAKVAELTQQVKLTTAEPLAIPVVGRFFDSWYPGIAGGLLVLASLFRGGKMSWFALPAAALIVIGPAFGPRVVMLLAGVILAALGFVFGRTAD